MGRIFGRADKIEAKDLNLADPALLSLFDGLSTAAGVTSSMQTVQACSSS